MRVAIVTGASSGIGRAACQRLVKEGWKVAALARRRERLEELGSELGEALLPVVCDVSKAGEVEQAVRTTQSRWPEARIEVFVANAGVMTLSHMSLLRLQEWKTMVDINVNGVLHSIAAILPVFRDQKKGHFLVLSSDADRKVFPGSAVYSGTKAFVSLMCEGLRAELCADGIPVKVSSLSSGAAATELAQHITDEKVLEGWKNGPPLTPMEADEVADVIMYCINAPTNVNVNNVLFRPVTQGQ